MMSILLATISLANLLILMYIHKRVKLIEKMLNLIEFKDTSKIIAERIVNKRHTNIFKNRQFKLDEQKRKF